MSKITADPMKTPLMLAMEQTRMEYMRDRGHDEEAHIVIEMTPAVSEDGVEGSALVVSAVGSLSSGAKVAIILELVDELKLDFAEQVMLLMGLRKKGIGMEGPETLFDLFRS